MKKLLMSLVVVFIAVGCTKTIIQPVERDCTPFTIFYDLKRGPYVDTTTEYYVFDREYTVPAESLVNANVYPNPTNDQYGEYVSKEFNEDCLKFIPKPIAIVTHKQDVMLDNVPDGTIIYIAKARSVRGYRITIAYHNNYYNCCYSNGSTAYKPYEN